MPSVPPVLRALIDAAMTLAGSTTTGRVTLARAEPLIPEGIVAALPELERLLARASEDSHEPIKKRDAEKALAKAWGEKPAKVLDDLDLGEPLAVRAAAVLYAGELDGEPVAVKLARPGLARTARADLALLETLAAPLSAVFGAADGTMLLREAREQLQAEFDLEHEASMQSRVRRALRDTAGVTVPRVISDLARENVLVTEMLDGTPLTEEAADDPERVGELLIDAHLAASRAGIQLLDSRPGHVLAGRDDNGIGLLGAGVAAALAPERAQASVDALAALRDRDEDAFAGAVGALGVLDGDDVGNAYNIADELAGDFVRGERALDDGELTAAADRALEHLGPLLELAGAVDPRPGDTPASRGLVQLVATLALLESGRDWTGHALRGG